MSFFEDTFLLTILIIVLSTFVIAFIRRIHVDRCLKEFRNDYVVITLKDGRILEGKLDTANTGIELIFPVHDANLSNGMSYIMYKDEYPQIQLISRYHDQMDPRNAKSRSRALQRAYHPGIFQRTRRHISNFFKTLKDAMMEIFTQLSGKIKSGGTGMYAGQEKYAQKVNQELVDMMDSSYNPLLEKYIGNYVIAESIQGSEPIQYRGILKDYTAHYIELWNVEMPTDNDEISLCDILLPVHSGKIRHVGERVDKFNLKNMNYSIQQYTSHFRRQNRRRNRKKSSN